MNSLVFYALSLMATDLGDKHMTLFLAGIVEVPGYVIGNLLSILKKNKTLFYG